MQSSRTTAFAQVMPFGGMKTFCEVTIEKWLQNIERPPTGPTALSGGFSATADALCNISVSGRHMSENGIDLGVGDDEGLKDLDATPRQLRHQESHRPASVSHSVASRSSHPQSDDSFSVPNDAPSTTSDSTFAAALRTRGTYFPLRVETRSPRTPSPPKRPQGSRHNSSPSKRAKTTTSLERLERPVRFKIV